MLNAVGNLELTGAYAEALRKLGHKLEHVASQVRLLTYVISFHFKILCCIRSKPTMVVRRKSTCVTELNNFPSFCKLKGRMKAMVDHNHLLKKKKKNVKELYV